MAQLAGHVDVGEIVGDEVDPGATARDLVAAGRMAVETVETGPGVDVFRRAVGGSPLRRVQESRILVAEVPGARDFRFEFGDGRAPVDVPADDGQATTRHVYPRAGHYDALITANPGSGDAVQKTLRITITPPDPVPPPSPDNRWLWLLLIAAILALLYTIWQLLTLKTGTHLVAFEPSLKSSKVKVTDSSAAAPSVSMHVRRDTGRTVLSVSDGA